MKKLFTRLTKPSTERSVENGPTDLQNPYVLGASGKKAWDDRYGNMSNAVRNWQWAFAGAMAVLFIAVGAMAKMSMESKVQPFVVETSLGMPVSIKAMTSISNNDQKLINYAINQFIINARSVLSDSQAEKSQLDKVYAYSSNSTIAFLADYYQTNNPFKLASQYTVSVNIVHTLPISQHTWQVTWDEVKRSASSGQVVDTTRWTADVTYQLSDVDPSRINDNPFGLYVTQLSWTASKLA